ncbi:hypothetical protein CGC48_05950 [Capnocytophaga cynodegmi]|uniref:Uncharacterized protein n=2 Tax=Capnocytophaga TaxID=1016 RepID=A0A250E5V1_9FLAO|nr:hypothetical protein [Capnocytophaga cynodegmi]ATA68211.1 hypothetical protein CGC48_05950 [Capnocytophaga cynodegmi]
MENAFLVYTSKYEQPIKVERFHICTWEFKSSSLIEFGVEIDRDSIKDKESLDIFFYVPWVNKNCKRKDLYEKLKESENSLFIFNDSISNTFYLDGGINKIGVVHEFSDRNKLCILPVELKINGNNIITATLNLKPYNSQSEKTNIYFRFYVEPNIQHISTRKKGINKTRIIYDIKINERRNIPDNIFKEFEDRQLCNIKTCFSFNIVPNKFDLEFFDNSSLKSVRTLEYESFNKYLGDNRVKKDDLIVVFNKKQDLESYIFFSMYAYERIGLGQFALAILINIICGFLLFLPSYREKLRPELSAKQILLELPIEIIIALVLIISTFIYFVFPVIRYWIRRSYLFVLNNVKKIKL